MSKYAEKIEKLMIHQVEQSKDLKYLCEKVETLATKEQLKSIKSEQKIHRGIFVFIGTALTSMVGWLFKIQ